MGQIDTIPRLTFPTYEQIKELDITHVISFNYTLTERLYGVDEENSHHIHGQT